MLDRFVSVCTTMPVHNSTVYTSPPYREAMVTCADTIVLSNGYERRDRHQ